MPSSKPLAAAATWLGWNARLKLSLISWTRGAAQKGDVPAFTAARNCRCLALARAQAIKIGSVISPHQNGLDVEDGTVDRHGRPRRARLEQIFDNLGKTEGVCAFPKKLQISSPILLAPYGRRGAEGPLLRGDFRFGIGQMN
jgi:hypothetical protein